MPSEDTPARRTVLVAALADNGVIGDRGSIPWHLPEDLAHFKATTLGHTLVMGRATWDSIGRPLPGRTTVVLTRDRAWHADGALVAHDLDEALALAADLPGDTMVVGGGEVYEQAMPLATHQVLTLVHLTPDGDARYPSYDAGEWVETGREHGEGWDRVWLARRPVPRPTPA
ncbi:dihydrofolate reductase [Nocardioides taihuensis]|uniref:Dihydrofolate reductase n=1 Tax=Nocardioides taihuensis TaxID=1835606 RepID=A0ABW0BRS9_9ACTN